MAKDPAQRFASPGAVAQALEPFTQTPIGPPPDNEMPHLSAAALGSAVPEPETLVRSTTGQTLTGAARPAGVSSLTPAPRTPPGATRRPRASAVATSPKR